MSSRRYLPPSIDIDVSSLDIGDSIHVGDVSLEKAEIVVDLEQTIVTVVPPTVYEEPVVEEEVAEVEVAEEESEAV